VGCGILPYVTSTHTLTDIEHALRACWAADTCSPDDLVRAGWSSGNPAWGHCDVTALVVRDLFGGVNAYQRAARRGAGATCWPAGSGMLGVGPPSWS
jgi:hypothetical protein